jgi:hypothetical protein
MSRKFVSFPDVTCLLSSVNYVQVFSRHKRLPTRGPVPWTETTNWANFDRLTVVEFTRIHYTARLSSMFNGVLLHFAQYLQANARKIILSWHGRGSRDSVVGIAIGNGLDDRGVGVRVPVGSRISSSPRSPDRLWGPTNLLSNGHRG